MTPANPSANSSANPTESSASQSTETLRYASDPGPEQSIGEVRLQLSQMDPTADFDNRCQQTLRLAEQAFSQTGSWVVFFREMFGPKGIVRTLFPEITEREKFQSTEPYRQLQEMLAAVRSQDTSKGDANEPERMITIRLPKSLHEALTEESGEVNLSINKLCITKLVQSVESRFVPVQKGRRRGRRPGPQGPRVVADKVTVSSTEPSSNGSGDASAPKPSNPMNPGQSI